ncbi:MAG: rRNA pseudouridine synthase [Clostridia bacterium]|nr:rRNA pseudouridine synthase [Clostridia bacterium]
MRIDKLISEAGYASRSEAAKAARKGNVTVNGETVKDLSRHIDPERDVVTFCGEEVVYQKNIYIMMNKPEGYVSSTDDKSAPIVLELLDERLQTAGLFPCGRLDKYTLGLLILTNDGAAAHKMLSPKKHVEKTYRFRLQHAISPEEVARLEAGVDIGGFVTKPCRVVMLNEVEGDITLTEGKYHQIKRMAEAVGNKIVYLERTAFAGISLDTALARGEWRYLNDEEMAIIAPYLS